MKPPLMLLSGLLCDETVWEKLTPALNEHAETRTFDFAGFDDIRKMADKVLEEAPRHFALAGHSMGARVALEVHRRAPERVTRLALLDTGVHPVKPGEAQSRQVLIDLAHRSGMAALAEKWLPPMLLPSHADDPAIFSPLHDMVTRMTPDIFSGQVKALLNRPDAIRQLQTLMCPTLVGVGRQDVWSPPEQHQMICQMIPNAVLSIFENSGHMAPFEAPQAVQTALIAWLNQ